MGQKFQFLLRLLFNQILNNLALKIRLSSLSTEQRDAVDALSKAVVAKLLHSPSLQLKHSAGTPQGERIAAALRDLFDIE